CGHYNCSGYYFKFTHPGSSTYHYVATTSQGCHINNCVTEDDTSGKAAPKGIRAGTNIANWFAYYHTRMLMAKSSLMLAFSTLSPNYRLGFGSINNTNTGNMPSGSYTGSHITIAKVKP